MLRFISASYNDNFPLALHLKRIRKFDLPLVLEDCVSVGKGELALLGTTLALLQWLKKFLNCSDRVFLIASSPHSSMLCIRYGKTCSVNSS